MGREGCGRCLESVVKEKETVTWKSLAEVLRE